MSFCVTPKNPINFFRKNILHRSPRTWQSSSSEGSLEIRTLGSWDDDWHSWEVWEVSLLEEWRTIIGAILPLSVYTVYAISFLLFDQSKLLLCTFWDFAFFFRSLWFLSKCLSSDQRFVGVQAASEDGERWALAQAEPREPWGPCEPSWALDTVATFSLAQQLGQGERRWRRGHRRFRRKFLGSESNLQRGTTIEATHRPYGAGCRWGVSMMFQLFSLSDFQCGNEWIFEKLDRSRSKSMGQWLDTGSLDIFLHLVTSCYIFSVWSVDFQPGESTKLKWVCRISSTNRLLHMRPTPGCWSRWYSIQCRNSVTWRYSPRL